MRSSEKLNRRAATNTEMIDLTDEQQDAKALLATVHHLMTGTEIDVCERIAAGVPFGEASMILNDAGELIGYTDPEQFAGYPTSEEQPLFDALKNQFYAKITNWKDGVAA